MLEFVVLENAFFEEGMSCLIETADITAAASSTRTGAAHVGLDNQGIGDNGNRGSGSEAESGNGGNEKDSVLNGF